MNKILGNIQIYGNALSDIKWLQGHLWNGSLIIKDKPYYVNIVGLKIMIFDHIANANGRDDEGVDDPATIWNMVALCGCWGLIDVTLLSKLITQG